MSSIDVGTLNHEAMCDHMWIFTPKFLCVSFVSRRLWAEVAQASLLVLSPINVILPGLDFAFLWEENFHVCGGLET